MKKIVCLTAALLLTASTISFAGSQESHSVKVPEEANIKIHDCSCIIQRDFEQYTSLIGLSKEDVLNAFYEKPLFTEDGGLRYSDYGAVIRFEDAGKGPVKSVFVQEESVDFNGAKVGDEISEFQEKFEKVIDEDKLEGYCSFEYKGKAITAYYHPETKRVLYVHISDNYLAEVKNETISNSVKFDNNINGVYFGNNINYELSETVRDTKLEEAIGQVYNLQRGVDKLNYYYNHVDLNEDNIKETFVYLRGPLVSGSGGDSALIFTNNDGKYQLVSRFSLVHSPIIISNNKTNGWHDIVMQVSGGGSEKFFAELKFDGNDYPSNPSIQPKLESGRVVVGTAIVADDVMNNRGIQF